MASLRRSDMRLRTATTDEVREVWEDRWYGLVVCLNAVYRPPDVEGLALVDHHDEMVALATYRVDGPAGQIVTLDTIVRGRGFGRRMLEAAENTFHNRGLGRAWALMTNDNLRAAGLYLSSLTVQPIIAAVSSFGLLLLLWVISRSGEEGDVFGYLSLLGHYLPMLRGLVDTADVVYAGGAQGLVGFGAEHGAQSIAGEQLPQQGAVGGPLQQMNAPYPAAAGRHRGGQGVGTLSPVIGNGIQTA